MELSWAEGPGQLGNKELSQPPGSAQRDDSGIWLQGLRPAGIPAAHGAAGSTKPLWAAPNKVLFVVGWKPRSEGMKQQQQHTEHSRCSRGEAAMERQGEPGLQLTAASGTGKGFDSTLRGIKLLWTSP